MIKVEAVLVNAVMPDSILVSIVGIGRGVGVVGGGTYGDDDYAVDGDDNGDDKEKKKEISDKAEKILQCRSCCRLSSPFPSGSDSQAPKKHIGNSIN